MSWWDTIVEGIEAPFKAAGNLGSTGFNAVAHNPVTNAIYGNVTDNWLWNHSAAPLGQVLADNPATKALAWETNQVSHLMSFTGVEAARFMGGDPRTFGDIGGAWDASRDISPGQALLSNPLFQQPVAQYLTGHGGQSPFGASLTGAGVHLDAYGAIDVTDPKVRQAAFESGGAGELGSWATDAVIQYYANPLVVAGAGAKVAAAKLGGVGGLRFPEQLGTRVQKEYAMLGGLEQKVADHGVDALNATEAGHWDLYQHIHDRPYVYERMRAATKRAGTDPELLTDAFTGVQNFDEYLDVYMASRGDVYSMNRLAARAPALHDAVQEARADLVDARVARQGITKTNPDNTITHEWQVADAEVARQQAILQDTIGRSHWLSHVTGGDLNDTPKLLNALERHAVVAPNAGYEALRRGVAATRAVGWAGNGFWTDQIIAPLGGLGAQARIVHWIGGHAPRGWVFTNGPRTAGSTDSIIDILKSANMDDATISHWTGRWIQAPTADARAKLLVAMEKDVTHKITTKHLGPNATQEQIDEAAKWTADFMRAYSASRDVAYNQYKQRGNWLWDDLTKTGTRVPMLDSMQAQGMPIMDFGLYDKSLREFGMGDLGKALSADVDRAANFATVFSSLWKASVLLRIGAIPRNLGESWLASWVFLGSLPGNPVHGAFNIGGNWKDKAFSLYNRDAKVIDVRNALLQKIEDLEGRRTTNIDSLTDLVEQQRRAGVASYYAQTPSLGQKVGTADIQMDMALGPSTLVSNADRTAYQSLLAEGERRQLTKAERDTLKGLHAKVGRKAIRGRLEKGQTAVVYRNGEYVPVKAKDLTEEELFGKGVIRPGRFAPEPNVYLMPEYTARMKTAPTPAATVSAGITPREGAVGDPWGAMEYPTLAEVYGTPDVLAEIQALQQAVARDTAHLTSAREATARIEAGMVKPPRRMVGRGPVSQGEYSGPGAFEPGTIADVAQKNVGAQARNEMMWETMESRAFRSKQLQRRIRILEGSHRFYDPIKEPNYYFKASTEFANRRIRNSDLAKHLFAYDDPALTARWLQETEPGRATLAEIGLDGSATHTVEDWTRRAYHNLVKTYPNEALRKTMLEREVTEGEIRAVLESRPDLVPVAAREYAPIPGERSGLRWLQSKVDGAYTKAWSQPENRLARYPLYDKLYRTEWQRLVRVHATHLEGMPLPEANAWIAKYIQPQAKMYATRTTQRVVYSSEVRANLAEKMRFISPFMQVTGNRLYFYGSQLLENPQNMARLFIGWNAISTTPNVFGDQVVTINLPAPVAKMFHIEDHPSLQFTKQSFNLIQNSDPWWSPGVGPIVTVPAAMVLRHYGDTPMAKKVQGALANLGVFPSGGYLGESAADQILPTWMRRYVASNGPQAANSLTQIMAIETWKYEHGLRDKPPTMDEVSDRNNWLWGFRIAAGFISPAQPVPTNNMVAHYTTIWRKYEQKYAGDATAKFLADYPEYFNVVLNYTTSKTGVNPSITGANRESKYGSIIRDMEDPTMGAMVTNLAGDNGQFDESAYQWELNRPVAPGSATLIRETKEPGAAVDDRLVTRGWVEYRALAKKRDSLLAAAAAAGGSRSIEANANDWIKILYDLGVQKIVQDTMRARPDGPPISPWQEQFATEDQLTYAKRADTLARLVRPDYYNANIDDQPWLASAKKYLDARKQIGSLLGAEAAVGGSGDINAQSNDWIRVIWDTARTRIADQDPQWQEWQTRYFAHDDLGALTYG